MEALQQKLSSIDMTMVIMLVILALQAYKLFRPFLLRVEWGRRLVGFFDRGWDFVSTFGPLVYDIIEAAQKKGILKKPKPIEFIERLREEAQKQNVTLTLEQEAAAQLLASGMAAQDHLPIPSVRPPLPAPPGQN